MSVDFTYLKDWIPIIMFFITILGGFWSIADKLNSTLKTLSFEIKRLHESIMRSEKEQLKMNDTIDKHDGRLDKAEKDIEVLKDWRKGYRK